MPLPKHAFDPPFNVVRCSHTVLRVRDLEASRRFYEGAIGLQVEDADSDALYLRGMEERNHHSLVLKKGTEPLAERLGYKVGSEEDLDRACSFFQERQLPAEFVEVPFQGRTLHAADSEGNPLELYASMDQAERILQHYGRYTGCHPQRIDHFNLFARDVQASVEFYAALGFRITEYTESECTMSPSPAGADPACTISPTGCPACSTSSTCATCWPPPAGSPTWSAGLGGMGLPTPSSSTCATLTGTASSSTPRITSPSTRISRRSAGR
jgi:catechol 2,3-dioxygenase-like lactoylglutathione lyase family enzyme